jgi:glyoxylase-like metal-dependent hydrolase (beta-lactamase superfamily II)
VLTLDLGREPVRPRGLYAAYLLPDGEPTLVDCGAGAHLTSLRAGLAAHGVEVGDLRHVLLTHVHLDHGGAAGALVAENPGLQVWVHPRGARHVIDPTRLIAGSRAVFGALFDRLWGETLPVPAANVHVIEQDGPLPLEREVEAFAAPGHAKHEVSFATPDGTIFAGDVGGVALGGYRFLEPPTPPADVDVEGWLRSLDAIEARRPARLALGHFGVLEDPAEPLQQLRATLLRRAEWVAGGQEAYAERVRAEIRDAVGDDGLAAYGEGPNIAISYAGLRRWWEERQQCAS